MPIKISDDLWKSEDDIQKEKQQAELEKEADEQEQVRRQMLDDFLELQAENYILNEDVPPEEKAHWKSIFEPFRPNQRYPEGKKIRYQGKVYEVIQTHMSQADWLPDELPSMFKEVFQEETSDGEEIIHDWVQPTSTTYYNIGDKVRFKGKIYESTINTNVWSPEGYPQGWRLIEE